LFAAGVDANLAGIVSETRGGVSEVALFHGGETVTRGELDALVRDWAGRLSGHGIGSGDRVAIVLPNSPAFVGAYFGALWLGAIAVPLNTLLSSREIDERLASTAPGVVVFDPGRTPFLAECGTTAVMVADDGVRRVVPPKPLPRRGSDAAVILFTSGTSGISKAAVLTHGSIGTAAQNAAEAFAFGPADIVLGAAPLSHVLGQATGLVATLATGGTVALVERFEAAETLELMRRTETTVLLGVPTMCIALCEAARTAASLPPLRLAHVGGAPMPVEVTREVEAMFGADVCEGYGLTEISGIATTYRLDEPRKHGSVGHPLGDTQLRIVSPDGAELPAGEVGEVRFRGASVIPGYWRGPGELPAPVSADGWLATGDLGYVDNDGCLFLVDRLKEMIIRGGYNVYPREVEEVLYSHPDVLEAVVVGVPDPRLGEEVVALVRPRPGSGCDPDDLRDWVRARVAAYKYPRYVKLVDALPTGPTGKIQKREIDREALARELTQA
jgi:long-chain acyl-CoA synthetase